VNENRDDQQLAPNITDDLFSQSATQQPVVALEAEPSTEGFQPVGSVDWSGVRPAADASVPSPVLAPLGAYGDGPVPPASTSPVAKKSKKKLVILLASLAACALLGAGLVYGYTIYQKPDNVALEAIAKALSAKRMRMKTTVTSDAVFDIYGTKLAFEKFTFDAGGERSPSIDGNAELTLRYGDVPMTIKASALLTENGDLYYRIDNMKKTIESFLPEGEALPAKAQASLGKIDGKWTKNTLADMKESSPESAKQAQCVLDAYKKYRDDKKSMREFATMYTANRFLVIKGSPVSKDGNYGYDVEIDADKAAAFLKSTDKTSLAKELNSCSGTKDGVISDAIGGSLKNGASVPKKAAPVTTTTLWISMWGHEIRSIETKTTGIESSDNSKFSTTSRTDVDFKTGVTTKIPANALSAKEWAAALTETFAESPEEGLMPTDPEMTVI